MKKGQTTIFIVLAIVIVIIIALFFFLKDTTEDRGRDYFIEQGLQPSINNVQNFIVDCLETNAKDAVVKIGIQGGYFNKPSNFFDMQWAFIPYYYDQGSFLQPSLNKIESEISDFVNEFLPFCIEDIVIEDILLKQESIKTITKINPGEVEIQSDMQITITKGDQTALIELTSYPTRLNSKLNEMYEISEYIIDSHREDPEFICINCMADMAEEKGLFVDMLSFEVPFTTLFIISEDTDSTNPKILEFLNKYPESETPIE